MYNIIATERLLKSIRNYSDETYPVCWKSCFELRKVIGQGIVVCKELLSKTGDVNKAIELYNKVCYENSVQNF